MSSRFISASNGRYYYKRYKSFITQALNTQSNDPNRSSHLINPDTILRHAICHNPFCQHLFLYLWTLHFLNRELLAHAFKKLVYERFNPHRAHDNQPSTREHVKHDLHFQAEPLIESADNNQFFHARHNQSLERNTFHPIC